MRQLALGLAVSLVGCGDDGGNPVVLVDAAIDEADAGPSGPCWPEVTQVPQGTATLGAGRGGFQPMPETLRLEYGMQDGFMFIAHARMTGFEPGDPENIFDPANPRTRIRAFFADTGVPLNRYAHCPFRVGYVPTSSGQYELAQEIAIVFETCWRSDRLIGKQFRIELEIMNGEGGYATDTKIVTAQEPEFVYPVEQNTPPCPP